MLDLTEKLVLAEAELSSKQHQCEIILAAKEYWADRARKAEERVAELEKLLEEQPK